MNDNGYNSDLLLLIITKKIVNPSSLSIIVALQTKIAMKIYISTFQVILRALKVKFLLIKPILA